MVSSTPSPYLYPTSSHSSSRPRSPYRSYTSSPDMERMSLHSSTKRPKPHNATSAYAQVYIQSHSRNSSTHSLPSIPEESSVPESRSDYGVDFRGRAHTPIPRSTSSSPSLDIYSSRPPTSSPINDPADMAFDSSNPARRSMLIRDSRPLPPETVAATATVTKFTRVYPALVETKDNEIRIVEREIWDSKEIKKERNRLRKRGKGEKDNGEVDIMNALAISRPFM